MNERTLGPQLTDALGFVGGTITIHENGFSLTGNGITAEGWWGLLGIGRPIMVAGDPATSLVMILEIEAEGPGVTLESITQLVAAATTGRVVLTPTAVGGIAVDLAVLAAENGPDGRIVVPITAPGMIERLLYDVAVVEGPVVAPHSVYFRREWRNFGLAHITDTHVARRIDSFRAILTEAGRHAAAAGMVNFNDRFRGFVRYANRLHDQGVLDLIVVTGDLYDYIHEELLEPGPNMNPELLRDLILGRSDSPEFVDVEELRVPIFLIPGNHDYRIRPYHLICDIQYPVVGTDAKRLPAHDGYLLTATDAAVITNRLYPKRVLGIPVENPPINDKDIPNVSTTEAADMVAFDRSLRDYRRFLGDPTSHTVVLGDHRIVLFDSGPDAGKVDSILQVIASKLGLASEDEETFIGGSPNCDGPSEGDVDEVARVLVEAPADGLVIVASHAPVFNMWGNEYPYFLRETQRRHQPDQVTAYLKRLSSESHPTWLGPDGAIEIDFVKRGNYDDHLDFGVSRGQAKRLLHVLVGVDVPRAADLVLTGHTHRDNEFVVRRLPGGEPAIFHDYYTENPGTYYPTVFATSVGADPTFTRTWLTVEAGADPGGTPTATPGHDHTHELTVPPYADPLNQSPDAGAWWATHRPLVLQTAALGPVSGLRQFAGFRVIEVTDNVISRISRVPMERLEQSGWTMDWESARAPIEVALPPEPPWLSVSEGATTSGAKVSAVPVDDRVALFVADPGGGIFTATGRPSGWSGWSSVSQGSTLPGGAVNAVAHADGTIHVVLANAGGDVFACRGSDTSWSNWVNVSEGSSTPGAPISAVAGADGLVSLFLADSGGGVYTCRGSGDHWGPWSSVSDGSTTPGGPVTAVADANGLISLFLADPGGGVFTCRGSGVDWSGWSSVSQGGTVPGGAVTALLGADGMINLFLADIGGGVFTCRGSGSAWGSWVGISQGSTLPGATVSAFRTSTLLDGHLAVALADAGGGVYITTGLDDQWASWRPLADGVTAPGTPITAVTSDAHRDVHTMVMGDRDGRVLAKWLVL